jgi:hypothetical protein
LWELDSSYERGCLEISFIEIQFGRFTDGIFDWSRTADYGLALAETSGKSSGLGRHSDRRDQRAKPANH